MSNLDYAAKQLNKIRNRIEDAAMAAGRPAGEIRLIGASKMHNAELLSTFIDRGLTDLGENYLQEALNKQLELQAFDIEWHFIGHIQSNKTKLVAEHFDWAHGVDRLKIASRLSTHNPKPQPLKVLLQINLDGEDSKSGVEPKVAAQLCDEIAQLDNVSLRGFMTIPKPRENQQQQREAFATVRNLLEHSNQLYGLQMNQLSMGMSNDLESAISQGSTMIRVGNDLFGARPTAETVNSAKVD